MNAEYIRSYIPADLPVYPSKLHRRKTPTLTLRLASVLLSVSSLPLFGVRDAHGSNNYLERLIKAVLWSPLILHLDK